MFRRIARRLVSAILIAEARLVLKKYKPKIVAITGSVGKTGAKDAIAAVLASAHSVRASQKSFNSEIGLPLTILNCSNQWSNFFGWLRNFIDGAGLIIFRSPYPEWLVLELGVDRPGDMRKIVSWLPPDIVVVTSLPTVPVHVEFFESTDALIKEKWQLALAVPADGLVLTNHDDEKISALAVGLKCRTMTYGFGSGAQVRGSDVHFLYHHGGEEKPRGLILKIHHENHQAEFRLPQVIGEHQLYAMLAAAAVGLAEKISLTRAAETLAELAPLAGRMRLLDGVKDTLIIDDSYNSSPAALAAALKTLGDLKANGRKIAVLGDMLELGRHAISEHQRAGGAAARAAQVLVTVGLRMKFAAGEAKKKKMGKKSLYHFDEASAAGRFLQNFIQPGDVILVKGSQSLRLERAVEEIMAEPEKKSSLLVRQEAEWLNKP